MDVRAGRPARSGALRVLVADEDRRALAELAAVIEDLGHEVTGSAVTAAEAADRIAREDPDLSFVMMHRDDEHALDLIAELGESASGPVVALLQHEDPEFVATAAERGVVAYAYPVTPETVQSAIEIATRRHAELARLGEAVEQLETALERRTVLERAKGILMERHRVDERRAFELLRRHARDSGRRAVDVARAVTEGHGLLPREPGERPGAADEPRSGDRPR
jgi:AmiR/NasT family two-component response regulator